MKKETIINFIKNDDIWLMDNLQDYSKEELNELSNDEETFPLLYAIKHNNGRYFIFNEEVLAKLDLNMTNKHGATALMKLSKYGMQTEAETLIKYGADWTMKDNKGKTALNYAQEYENTLDEDTNSFMVNIILMADRYTKLNK